VPSVDRIDFTQVVQSAVLTIRLNALKGKQLKALQGHAKALTGQGCIFLPQTS